MKNRIKACITAGLIGVSLAAGLPGSANAAEPAEVPDRITVAAADINGPEKRYIDFWSRFRDEVLLDRPHRDDPPPPPPPPPPGRHITPPPPPRHPGHRPPPPPHHPGRPQPPPPRNPGHRPPPPPHRRPAPPPPHRRPAPPPPHRRPAPPPRPRSVVQPTGQPNFVITGLPDNNLS